MTGFVIALVILGIINLLFIMLGPNDKRILFCIPILAISFLTGFMYFAICQPSPSIPDFMITIMILTCYYYLGFKYARLAIDDEIEELSKQFKEAVASVKTTNEKEFVDAVMLKLYKSKRNVPFLENKTYPEMVKVFFPSNSEIICNKNLYASIWLVKFIYELIVLIYDEINFSVGEHIEITKILKENPFDEGKL